MAEVQFPCGEWFVPPRGSYTAWLESESWISPSTFAFSYGGGPFRGRGTRLLMPVVPAGRVAVFFEGQANPGGTVRFLSLDGTGQAIERRTSLEAARRGVLMPARRALAAVFGDRDDALALSRPVQVKAHDTTTVKLDRPKAATVLAILGRPATKKGRSTAAVRLILDCQSGIRSPDVILDTPARVFAVWYDISGSNATLRMESEQLDLEEVGLALAMGRVATVRQFMSLRRDASARDNIRRQ